MNFFETPNDLNAYVLGMSVTDYENMQDAVTEDEETLYAAGEPHLSPEDRTLIPEGLVSLVSNEDREHLATMLDLEAWEGMGS